MTELPIILDDLIGEELQNQIEDAMFDCNWKFNMDNTIQIDAQSIGKKYREFLNPFKYNISPSITANLQKNQKTFKLFNPIIEKTCDNINFNLEKISRCIAGIQGVQVIRKNSKMCGVHINQIIPHLVLLYYVNDSNGETILFNENVIGNQNNCQLHFWQDEHNFSIDYKILPKKGRILLFDGRTYHSASSPTEGIRCTITLDLFGKFGDGSYNFPAPKIETKKNNMKYQ